MVKPARARRDRQRKVAGRQHEDGDDFVRRTVGRTSEREERVDDTVTVQLLPHFLVAGALPRVGPGDEIDVAPAIYAGDHLPSPGTPDRWRVDPHGTMDAHGTVLTTPLSPGSCDCLLDILDAGGRLFPLNWAGTAPTEGHVWIEGALYLDPELSLDADHGDSVALCRRRHRVRAVRRYRLVGGRPHAPVTLGAVPGPDDVADQALYVADLVPVETDPREDP